MSPLVLPEAAHIMAGLLTYPSLLSPTTTSTPSTIPKMSQLEADLISWQERADEGKRAAAQKVKEEVQAVLASFSKGKTSFETSKQQLADLKSQGQSSMQVCSFPSAVPPNED